MGNPYCEKGTLVNPSQSESERAALLARLQALRDRLDEVGELEHETKAELDLLQEELLAGEREH